MRTITTFAFCAAIFACESARGAVVEYRDADRDQWFTDVGGVSNISIVDFAGLPDDTLITDQWAHLGIHFSGQVESSGVSFFFFPNDGWGCRGEPDINVTFDAPIQWIAADFPGTAVFDLLFDGQLIHTSQSFGEPGVGHFGGLISDQLFDQVRIYRLDTDLTFLDDLHFGPPIPTPASLTALALAMLLKGRRRR